MRRSGSARSARSATSDGARLSLPTRTLCVSAFILLISRLSSRTDPHGPRPQQIGRFLLSLLPSRTTSSQASPSTVASTPDILLQAIDSLIDLYADEEREYDVPVFREGGMLQALEGSVPGVRAAVRLSPLLVILSLHTRELLSLVHDADADLFPGARRSRRSTVTSSPSCARAPTARSRTLSRSSGTARTSSRRVAELSWAGEGRCSRC